MNSRLIIDSVARDARRHHKLGRRNPISGFAGTEAVTSRSTTGPTES